MMVACGAAAPPQMILAPPPVAPVVETPPEEPPREPLVAAETLSAVGALLDVIERSDPVPLTGPLIVRRGGDHRPPLWGTRSENHATFIIVGAGLTELAMSDVEEVDLAEATTAIESYVASIRSTERDVLRRSMFGRASLIAPMVLRVARMAREAGEDELLERLVRSALDAPHLSEPFDGDTLMKLRGDVALDLLAFALTQYGGPEQASDNATIARLEVIAELTGTEAADQAIELAHALSELRDNPPGPQDAYRQIDVNFRDVIRRRQGQRDLPSERVRDATEERARALVSLLGDRRPIQQVNRDEMSLDLVRAGDAALEQLSQLSGERFHNAQSARAWWDDVQGDFGYRRAEALLESDRRGRRAYHISGDTLVARMFQADPARARRDVPRIFGRAQYGTYGRTAMFRAWVAADRDHALNYLKREIRRRGADPEEIVNLITSSRLDDGVFTRYVERRFRGLLADDDLGTDRGAQIVRAMTQLGRFEEVARAYGSLSTRTRLGLGSSLRSEWIRLAVVEDPTVLSSSMRFNTCSSPLFADSALSTSARLTGEPFDCSASLEDRLTRHRTVAAALRAQIAYTENTPPPWNVVTLTGDRTVTHRLDPRNALEGSAVESLVSSFDQAPSEGAFMRLLSGLVIAHQDRPMILAIRLMRRDQKFEIELHPRPRRSPQHLRFEARVTPNEGDADIVQSAFFGNAAVLLNGAGLWEPLRDPLKAFFRDETVRDVTVRIEW